MAPRNQFEVKRDTLSETSAPTLPDSVSIRTDQPVAAQAVSPVATLSSHLDPEPHYLASAICTGTGAWMYFKRAQAAPAAAAVGFGLLYLWAGRAIITGQPRLGYDAAAATSLGLLAWTAPKARISGANTVLATVGGLSAAANLIKSYQQRTGKIKEMAEH